MNAYSPRRQNKRWLNGDCPREILAIYRDKREPSEPYTIIYAELQCPEAGRRSSLVYIGLSEDGRYSHGEFPASTVGEYRYRNAHRACKWTDLPAAVQVAVIRDIAEDKADRLAYAKEQEGV
jgi:hypothetical protein